MLKVTAAPRHLHDAEYDLTLLLPYEQRVKGRVRVETTSGEVVGLFLDRGKVLKTGDILTAECGTRIRVQAQDEKVMTARCDDWLIFSRCCYHLGNRHVPLQIDERCVRFQPDHVLAEMVELYGMKVTEEMAPFEPERGAYSSHGHAHGHSHQHHHDQEHDHAHSHSHSHAH